MRLTRSWPWRILQAIARPLAMLLFRLKVCGSNNVPSQGGVLIVSNHQSYLDPILLPIRLKRPVNYIAKSELFRNRIFGWFLRAILNAFPVRQGRGDIRAVKETIRRLQEGHVMTIYPEGARTEDGEIGPLQPGVALIIKRANVSVVPAVIVGAYDAWPIHRRFFRCRPIYIQFGLPIDIAGQDDVETLATIEKTLQTMFVTLRSDIAHGRDPRRE